MKFVPVSVTRAAARALLKTKKYSPSLLFGTGVVGVAATAILASRATLKLEDTLDEIEQQKSTAKFCLGKPLSESAGGGVYTEDDLRRDMVILNVRAVGAVAKLYAPTIAVGAVSIGCLTGSHVILTNRNVALTAAYASLERAYNGYRRRVEDAYGTETELELHHGVETRDVTHRDSNGNDVVTKTKLVDGTRSVYARFFDECSRNWCKTPEYNHVFLKCQQNYANDLLRSRGHVFLNEVYDMLGIERSNAGAIVGWILGDDGDNFVDFGLYVDRPGARDFVNGRESSILLDFNVNGIIYDKI